MSQNMPVCTYSSGRQVKFNKEKGKNISTKRLEKTQPHAKRGPRPGGRGDHLGHMAELYLGPCSRGEAEVQISLIQSSDSLEP